MLQVRRPLIDHPTQRLTGLMVRLRLHLVREIDDLPVHALAHKVVDEPRRPRRRPLVEQPRNELLGITRAVICPGNNRVDDGLGLPLRNELLHECTCGRSPIRLCDAVDHHRADHLGGFVIVDALDDGNRRVTDLFGHARRIGGFRRPLPRSGGNVGLLNFVGNELGIEEVASHEPR